MGETVTDGRMDRLTKTFNVAYRTVTY